MIVMAIDPSGSTTGFAFGDGKATPHASIWNLRGFSDLERAKTFGAIYAAVNSLVRANHIECVVIEAPLRIDGKSAHTERMLTMLSGAAQAGAANGGALKIETVAPQTWRKDVLGHGFPKSPKQAALDYCKLRGWRIEDHNAAEAACILTWAHDQIRAKML